MGEKLISKHNRESVIESDNTRVAKPIVVKQRLDPWFLELSRFKTSPTGTTTTNAYRDITHNIATSISDDGRTLELGLPEIVITPPPRNFVAQGINEAVKKVGSRAGEILAYTAPSTWIGPVFRNNDKSYWENVSSLEGFGNPWVNLGFDVVVPSISGSAFSKLRNVEKSVKALQSKIKNTQEYYDELYNAARKAKSDKELQLTKLSTRIGDLQAEGKNFNRLASEHELSARATRENIRPTAKVDPTKMSDEQLNKFVQRRLKSYSSQVKDGVYTPSNSRENLFTTGGEYEVPIFGTNDVAKGSISTGSFNQAEGLAEYNLRTGAKRFSTPANTPVNIPEDYIQALQKNIDYLQQRFPGFKPLGSSVGVTKGGLPHVTHDIDGFITEEAFNKIKNFEKQAYRYADDGTPITYKVNVGNQYGEAGNIDFNIIYRDPKTGMATGRNAEELYRQLFPDDYERLLINGKKDVEFNPTGKIVLDKTPEELMEAYDPVTKTIQDSFEIDFNAFGKGKHAGRPIMYISYGNPKAVSKALDAYAKSYVGSGVQLPKIKPEYFSNPERNMELLKKWNMSGDLEAIAKDPEKMQNAFDYWVLNNTVLSRGVGTNALPTRNIPTIKTALTTWNNKSIGGNAYGAGTNYVTFGDSGYGPWIGKVQPRLRIDNLEDPMEITNAILHQFGRVEFTPDELNKLSETLRSFGIRVEDIKTPEDFLSAIPNAGQRADDALRQLSDLTGIDAITREGIDYGNSIYTSAARPFTGEGDILHLASVKTNPKATSLISRKRLIDQIKDNTYDPFIRDFENSLRPTYRLTYAPNNNVQWYKMIEKAMNRENIKAITAELNANKFASKYHSGLTATIPIGKRKGVKLHELKRDLQNRQTAVIGSAAAAEALAPIYTIIHDNE